MTSTGAGERVGRVVVVGAGMTGLFTARALAGHVEHVSVLERERLPPTTSPRPVSSRRQ